MFVTTTLPRSPGGATPSFVLDLASRLVADHGMELEIVAPHAAGLATSENLAGVRITRFRYSPRAERQRVAYGHGIPDNLRSDPWARFQLPAFVASMALSVRRALRTADLVHAHWVEPACVASVANLGRGVPMVVSVHKIAEARWRRSLYRWTLRRADRVLFNSAFTLRRAQGIDPHISGQVVYQGYDDTLFGPGVARGRFRERHGIPPDAVVATALGRMVPVKGLVYLARAASDILRSQPNAHLVLAGDGPERDRVRAELDHSGHPNRAHCPGALRRAEVAELLADSDVFVIPSIVDLEGNTESLGVTTLEAMACGLPCVGSEVGGIPETIADGQTGFLVPPADPAKLAEAIGRLFRNDELRTRMGRAAGERAVQSFSWSSLARGVAAIYAELLSERAGLPASAEEAE